MPVSVIDPSTALVLIDFQRGITALVPREVIVTPATAAARLAAEFRARRMPVILVRTTFAADGGDVPRNRVQRAPAVGPFPERPSDFLEELHAEPSDIIVTKRQPGAFHGTDLDLQLRRRHITAIVLGGLLTSYTVETTGRDAYDRGFNVVLASDAMADIDPLDHAHSLESVFPRLGEVDDSRSILALMPVVQAA